MPKRAWLVVLAAVCFVGDSALAVEPSEVTAASVLARAVSADVKWLADDDLGGRGSGSPGGALAEEQLIDELVLIGSGLDASKSGRDAYRQDFGDTDERTNLLAVVPGGAHADEFVVVGAHYDHFAPGGCKLLNDGICNGATDNASGVAVVLAIGRALRALPTPPARSVVLALWDGEEIGLLGSKHFVKNPLIPLSDVVAYINFDIQGANLAPSARELSFAVGAESGGEMLSTFVQDAIDRVGLGTQRLTLNFGQGRSDYAPFWGKQIPVAFFTDATNACYHTSSDDVDIVDFRKLSRQSETGFRLVVALSEAAGRPTFEPPIVLDTYEDLLVLSQFLTRTLVDLAVVAPAYRGDLVRLESTARARVADGPEAFGPTDALTIAQDALEIATSGLPCDPAVVPEVGAGSAEAAALLAGMALAAKRRASLRSRYSSSSRSNATPRCPNAKRSGHSISA